MKKIVKKLIIVAIISAIALPIFILSNFCINNIIIPTVSSVIGKKLEAKIDWSYLSSELSITDLNYNDEVKISKAFIKYNLTDIIGGKTSISKLELEDSNIDLDLTKTDSKEDKELDETKKIAQSDTGTKNSKPLELNIESISIKNTNLKITLPEKKELILNNLNIDASNIINNTNAKLALSTGLAYSEDKLKLRIPNISIDLSTALTNDLKPNDLALNIDLDQLSAIYLDKKVSNISLNISSKIKANAGKYKIEKINLIEKTSKYPIKTQISITGEVTDTPTATLKVTAKQISPQILNLISTISSKTFLGENVVLSSVIDIKYTPTEVYSLGNLKLNNIKLRNPNVTGELPLTDLLFKYEVGYNIKSKTASLNNINLNLINGQKNLLRLYSTSPFNFKTASKEVIAQKGAKLNLIVNNLEVKKIVEKLNLETDLQKLPNSVTLLSEFTYLDPKSIQNATRLIVKDLPVNKQTVNVSSQLSTITKFEADGIKLDKTKLYVQLNKQLTSIIAGNIKFSNSDRIEANLSALLQNNNTLMAIAGNTPELRKLINYSLNTSVKLETSLKTKDTVINALKLGLKKNKIELAKLKLLSPYSIKSGAKEIAYPDVILNIDNLPIRELPVSPQTTKLQDGYITSQLSLTNSNKYTQTITGNIDIKNMILDKSLGIKGRLTSLNKINTTISHLDQVDISDFNSLLYVNNKKAIELDLNGNYSIKTNDANIELELQELNDTITKAAGISLPLQKLSVNSINKITLQDNFNRIQLKGKINADTIMTLKNKKQQEQKAFLTYSINKLNDKTEIEGLKLISYLNDEVMVNTIASGSIGKKNIDISLLAKTINADLIQGIDFSTPESKKKAKQATKTTSTTNAPAKQQEPTKTSEEQADINIKLQINDLIIKNNHIGIDSRISYIKKVLRLNPLTITSQDDNLKINAVVDMRVPNDYKYKANIQTDHLDLSEELASVLTDSKIPPSMLIDSLNLNLAGRGIKIDKIKKNTVADLKLKLKDLSLPASLKEHSTIMNLIVGSLETISTALRTLPINASEQFNNISKVLSNKKNLEFTNGVIDINYTKGDFKINQLELNGSEIKSVRLDGGINSKGGIKVKTTLDFGIMEFPIPISGTIDKPRFSEVEFMKNFVSGNLNKVKNGAETIISQPDKLYKAINNKEERNKLLNDIFGNKFIKKSDKHKTTEEQKVNKKDKEESKKKLKKDIKNLINSFF